MENAAELFSLKGKIAVVTGGAGVLGLQMARGLGKAGAAIVICDIKNAEEKAQELKAEGIAAKGYFIDVLQRMKSKNAVMR